MSNDEQGNDLRHLEARLHDALRPVDLPEGFAARVRQQLAAHGGDAADRSQIAAFPMRSAAMSGALGRVFGFRAWRNAIAAVLLLAVLLVGWNTWHARRQQAEAARARQQFELAMQVTARSLGKVRRDLERRSAKGEVQ